MDFLNFARMHGIVIDHLPPLGVWKRYPTEDKRSKRNGAVKFMGDYAFVQNHALDTEVSIWKGQATPERAQDFQRLARLAERERERMQQDAIHRAAAILKACTLGTHQYLKDKGFDDEHGNIYTVDGKHALVIPMRVGPALVGCQVIQADGTKKFLYGQRTAGAEFVFNNKGHHILCEGYATALSIRAALKAMKRRYTLHVCFSAGNMKKIAATLNTGMIVADNDQSGTGERTAKEIGWPYWMSEVQGEDANDTHRRVGTFKLGLSLVKSLDSLAPIYG